MYGVTLISEESPMSLKSRMKVVIAEYEMKHGKLKRAELAEQIGITPQYLSEIISGRPKNVDTGTLFKLAKVLGCTVDDLYILEGE